MFEQNDGGADIYFLTNGTMRAHDRSVVLGEIDVGGYFGEMAAIDGLPRSAGILAITDATVACMPASVFREFLQKCPDANGQFLKHLVTRIRELDRRL